MIGDAEMEKFMDDDHFLKIGILIKKVFAQTNSAIGGAGCPFCSHLLHLHALGLNPDFNGPILKP